MLRHDEHVFSDVKDFSLVVVDNSKEVVGVVYEEDVVGEDD